MAYIGSTPTSQNFIAGTDYFNGTGSQTAFTLTRTVNSVNDIEVVINNVVQQPSTAYTLSGTTITFTSAPSSGTNNIYVRYLATNMQSFTVPANSITRTQLDSNLQAGFQGRNRIINGSFNIWQRGTSSSSAGYLADRWQLENAGTFAQSSDVPSGQGFPYSCSVAVTTGTAYGVIKQKIEAANCVDLVGKSVTLTFWLKNVTGDTTMYCILHHANSTDNFGGVTSIESKSFTAVANTWTKFTLTYANLPSGAANGLQVYIFSADGSVAPSYLITGVQLEEGTTATSFERESYSVTLQKCQRYYEVIYADNSSLCIFSTPFSSQYRAQIWYKVQKRATATFALYSGGSWQGSTPEAITSGLTQTNFYSGSATYYLIGTANTPCASISAEL